MKVTIRPLEESDALLSYKWRNDEDIWKYTGNKPDKKITLKIEKEWIKKVIVKHNEKRFAICVGNEMEYVGNVQLTDITKDNAQFHIFIGKKKYHGLGIGTQATKLIIDYGFKKIKIKTIYLTVNPENIAAVRSYEKCGFKIISKSDNELKMEIKNYD
ncbi:MAG: GNAT family N-acetyltransferase [Bacteroidales bacterium]|jgi:RimJ/RimL family protein N-acetyltransferase